MTASSLDLNEDPAPTFWSRPHDTPATQPAPSESSFRRAAGRLLTALGSINNLLLPPMATIMVLEIVSADSTRELISADWLMLQFCVFFAIEWLLGLLLAKSKRAYLWNFWLLADLLSAIPFSWLFQSGRVVRIARVTRILRLARYRKLARVARIARFSRLKLDVGRVLQAFGLLASISFSGALALRITEPETIKDLPEGMWWALVTMSAVGYGDITPTTLAGRAVGMILILGSLGVFGYAAALATSALTHNETVDKHSQTLAALKATEDRIASRLDRLEAVTERIEASLNRSESRD
jgi:voltage-gated potassium channel